jgi:hypothetical protein
LRLLRYQSGDLHTRRGSSGQANPDQSPRRGTA